MQPTIQTNSSWVLRADITTLRGDQSHLKLISFIPSARRPSKHVQFAGTFSNDELRRLQSLLAEALEVVVCAL